MAAHHSPSSRRRRVTRRGLPALAGLAVAALVAGVMVGRATETEAERAAERYVGAWERRDWDGMYALLSGEARRPTRARFARAYRRAADTATARSFAGGDAEERNGTVTVPMRVRTRIFGVLRRELDLKVRAGRVEWAGELVFPGMPPGSKLSRRSEVPPRAAILTRDGERLVEGPANARTPVGDVGASIAGQVGVADPAGARELYARGFPRDAPVGLSGLERILERRVAGRPGGTLLASGRILASSDPRPARPVRTSIDADVQRAAVVGLADRLGGVAALDARTGQVRALAGIAFSAPQPPGSTFKIVTATAALERRLVKTTTPFPVETMAVIDGVELENANGESCGGTFVESFAHSCNSVFAPLGVRIGAERLVATAERYGFNAEPRVPGAVASTLPPAAEIQSPLEVGSTAIGQGRVLATPLLLASMAQTIASGGVRREPSVLARRRGRAVRVTSRRVARALEQLMIAVVEYGTGVRASLAPTKVAGKTGTAELEDTTRDEEEDREQPPPGEEGEPPGFDTDAWFTAYAPARRSKLAVAVLLVRNGAGGDTAAPVARAVLQAGLAE